MSIDTSFTLQPTDTDVTPQTPDAPQPAEPATPAPKPAPAVQHADGGLPAIPLLVITGNTAAAGLSAAAVVGGPLAAAGVAAAGVVTAAAAAASARRKTQKPARRAQVKPAPKKTPPQQNVPTRTPAAGASRASSSRSGATRTGSGTRSLGGGRSSTRHSSGSSARKATAGKSVAAPKKTTGPSLPRTAPAGAGLKPTSLRKSNSSKTAGKGSEGKGAASKTTSTLTTPKSRIGQIKNLRNAKKTEGKSRREQREQNTANRRALKDGRRGEKKALKNLKKQNKADTKGVSAAKPGKAGVTASLAKAAEKKTDAARNKVRAHKDGQAVTRGERIRQGRRNATARAALTRKVAASQARYATKAAGAAILSAPAALLGCLTTPIGRKLGWSWLMYPGRRMYRRLTANAKHNHQARVADAKNTHAHTTDPASLEIDQTIADGVPRGPRQNQHTATLGEPVMTAELRFHFDESAADMEAAAAAYEPGGMIHVYQTIQGMPAGIQSWANTFKILAEKSDESFPLEAEVGEALTEVFELLQKAATAAEDVQKVFETKHEQDLERLQSPRKSLEAEKAWDVGSNEDLL